MKTKYPSGAARFMAALLAFVLLLAGMGAASAQTIPPPPPPDRYGDWQHPEKALPLPVIQGGLQTQGSPSLQNCYSGAPNKLDWTALVFTGTGNYDWNGDIYINRGVCSGSTPTRLTTNSDWDTYPRLNRDASQVVFMGKRNNDYDVYIMSSTGAGLTNLTNSPYYEGMPSFAGTDSRIVYMSAQSGTPDIYIMNPDGSGKYQLTSGPDYDVEPDWSPDGKQITFAREIPHSNLGVIYVMNWDGTNLHAITPPLAYASRPVWSPSGTRIAFGYDYNGDDWFDLAIINADGSGLYNIPISKGSNPYTDFYNGSWLPEENGLVFSGYVYSYDSTVHDYYIQAYNAYQVLFSNLTVAQPLNLGLDSIFTPYARSLDNTPPVSSLAALPEYSRYNSVPLNWTVSDNYSGPAKVNFQYYTNSNSTYASAGWQTFYTPQLPAQSGQTNFTGVPGDKVFFRAQAVDFANNSEPLKVAAEASTRLYQWQLTARVTDTRERPLAGANVALTPAAMLPLKTAANGSALTYTTASTTFQADVSKPGYAKLPALTWPVVSDSTYLTALPGAGEQIINGQFEDTSNPAPEDPLAGWTASGGPVTAPAGMLGGKAASIAVPVSAQAATVSLGQPVTIPADMSEPTLSFYYQTSGGAQSHLKAIFTPQGETAVTLFDRAGGQPGWTHVWVDMTPHLGKTGTLAFVVEKAANETYTALLDQVSLASALGLTISQINPVRVAAPLESDLTVDVWGTNFYAGSTLSYGGNSTPFTLLDSTHLTFVIPAGTQAGPYPVRLQSGSVEVTYPQPVFIGTFLYLPFTYQK